MGDGRLRVKAITKLKLPWQNSWFQLAAFSAVVSGAVLISDIFTGQFGHLPHVSIPFFAKPGSLTVTSETPGAQVHIDGETDMAAPATFPKLSVDTYKVVVSAPGYDPVTKTVEIKEAMASSLDSGYLQRSVGTLNLTTTPPGIAYSLQGTAADNLDNAYHGTTPASLPNLPTDTYKLTLSAEGMETRTVNVDIGAHQTTNEDTDIVKLNLASEADPAVAKALLGQTDASGLTDEQKKDFTRLMNQAFETYLRDHAFGQATSALSTLKSAGEDTQVGEKKITDAQNGYAEELASQVKALIADGKPGAAESKLKALKDSNPPEVADPIAAQFQDKLADYQQKVSDAIQAGQTGDPAADYDTLKTFGEEHPDDVTVQLALGNLLTHLPPDHTRLGKQLAAFKAFSRAYLGVDEKSQLDAMQAKFQNELATYDRLYAQLNKAKENSGGDGSVDSLQKEINRDKAQIAAASGVNRTVETITSIFHQRLDVVDVSDKQAEIKRDQDKIDGIQNAQSTSKSAGATAQQQFDAFCAVVPW
jgi:hypothetical protein